MEKTLCHTGPWHLKTEFTRQLGKPNSTSLSLWFQSDIERQGQQSWREFIPGGYHGITVTTHSLLLVLVALESFSQSRQVTSWFFHVCVFSAIEHWRHDFFLTENEAILGGEEWNKAIPLCDWLQSAENKMKMGSQRAFLGEVSLECQFTAGINCDFIEPKILGPSGDGKMYTEYWHWRANITKLGTKKSNGA